MKKSFLIYPLLVCLAGPVAAQGPQTLNYQGKVLVSGAPFTGAGQFRFALVDGAGNTLWSNDGSSVSGSEPSAAVSLTVTAGLYSVLLGDTSLGGMTEAVTPAAVAGGDVLLRTWFDDGTPHGSQLLSPDQRLSSVAWALQSAEAATVPDGAITSSKLAVGSVGAGTLDVPIGPLAGEILGYNAAGDLEWMTPGPGGGTPSWLLGGNAGVPGGSFLGTTDGNDLEFRANNEYAFRVRASDRDLILPSVPSGSLLFLRNGSNGLGTYGTNPNDFGGGTVGRNFGGLDVDGPVLYGEGGGALGVTYYTGGTPPFFFDATFVEKPVLAWSNAAGNGGTVHIGGYGANGDPKLMVFGDGDYIHIGENVSDDRLEFKATQYYFLNGNIGYDGQLTKLDIADNFASTIRSADLFLGHSSRRGTPGRALVDLGPELVVNFASDWGQTTIGGNLTYIVGDTSVRTLTIRGGADLAEPFAMSSHEIEPGSVVVIDAANPGKLRLSTSAYDRKVAGIVSGANGINPGISMIQEDKLEAGKNVALSGRVYVHADAGGGAIEPGDLLTTSSTPGHAMKAADHAQAQGAILGKAMTGLADGSGMVLVLVTLQ